MYERGAGLEGPWGPGEMANLPLTPWHIQDVGEQAPSPEELLPRKQQVRMVCSCRRFGEFLKGVEDVGVCLLPSGHCRGRPRGDEEGGEQGLGSWVRRTEEKGPGGQRRAGWDPWWDEPSDRTAKE